MRRFPACVVVSLAALAAFPGIPLAAEATRTIRAEIPATPFAVENLAGAMTVLPGSGDAAVVVATVHAEDEDLAGSVRLEQVRGKDGLPTLRVIYPTERHRKFRYAGGPSGESLIGRLFDVGSSTTTEYGGRRVEVSGSGGVAIHVDVEVRLPARPIEATFRNLVGSIAAEGIAGTLRFDGASAEVTASDLTGDITVDTGSGDVRASGIEGTFLGDTGSGDIDLSDVSGKSVVCDTGSGTLTLRGIAADRIVADTGSGDILVSEADAIEFSGDTGSGDLVFEAAGSRLEKVKADTGSGDVTLRLPTDAGFEVSADVGSGDLVNRFGGAEAIRRDEEIVGYRRGDARILIEVDTGSGDVTLEPAR